MTHWGERFIKQGTVKVGDKVYIEGENDYRFNSAPQLATVTRVTKTLVVAVKDNTPHDKGEQTFRWQPRNEQYADTTRFHEARLVTIATGEAAIAHLNREKAIQAARGKAVQAIDPIDRNRRWINAEMLRTAAAQLTALADELAALEGDKS